MEEESKELALIQHFATENGLPYTESLYYCEKGSVRDEQLLSKSEWRVKESVYLLAQRIENIHSPHPLKLCAHLLRRASFFNT